MADYKKDVADYLRTQGSYDIPVDANDDEVIAFVRDVDPDTLSVATKEAYGQVIEAEKPRSTLEKFDARLDEVNKDTERYAGLNTIDADNPIEKFGILAAKGLGMVTGLGRTAGDAIRNDPSETVGNVLGGMINPLIPYIPQARKAVNELAASQFPHTPLQSAFAILTAPLSSLKGIKAPGVRSPAVPPVSELGEIAVPSKRFPESRLAAKLESWMSKTKGAKEFEATNVSAVDAAKQKIASAKSAEEKIKAIQNLTEAEEGARKASLGEASQKFEETLFDLEEKVSTLRDETHTMAVRGETAKKIVLAQENALKADLSVRDAFEVVNRAERGTLVGRDVLAAKAKAAKDVDAVYTLAKEIGATYKLDTAPIASELGGRLNAIKSELTNVSDDRSVRVLRKINKILQDVPSSDITYPELGKLVKRKPKQLTLTDVMDLYADLGELSRNSTEGSALERTYRETADVVLKYANEVGERRGTGARIAFDTFTRAREARIALDARFNNVIVEATEAAMKKNPEAIFKKLLSGNAETPLRDFMEVASPEGKAAVRGESLKNAFEALSDAKPGKGSETLKNYTEKIGKANYNLIHGDKDQLTLGALAQAKDELAAIEKKAPEILKEINSTVDSIADLATKFEKEQVPAIKATYEARIEAGIKAIEDAYRITTVQGKRAGETGQVLARGTRRGDEARRVGEAVEEGMTDAVAMGADILASGGFATAAAMGSKPLAALSTAILLARFYKKAPNAFAKFYYSPAGRAVVEGMAAAPTAAERAKYLVQIGARLGPAGVAGLQRASENQPKKPSLGQLDNLRKQNGQTK